MKNNILIASLSLLGLSTYAIRTYNNSSTEVQNALIYGADSSVVFRVIDKDGNPVDSANVKIYYERYPSQDGYVENKVTDTNGYCICEGTTTGEILYTVSKEGFYATRNGFHFTMGGIIYNDEINGRIDTGDVENNRWLPYGFTNTVCIKEVKNPIKMKDHFFSQEFTVYNTLIGCDLLKGDFVKPYGTGDVSDFCLKISGYSLSDTNYNYTISFVFTNCVDGVYMSTMDKYSDLKSDYQADLNAVYTNELVYTRVGAEKKQDMIDTSLSSNSYLVLRTRSKTNDNGNILSANYSKIYGPISFSYKYINFVSYFNVSTNSMSLECE